jgi:hypothetical protein
MFFPLFFDVTLSKNILRQEQVIKNYTIAVKVATISDRKKRFSIESSTHHQKAPQNAGLFGVM